MEISAGDISRFKTIYYQQALDCAYFHSMTGYQRHFLSPQVQVLDELARLVWDVATVTQATPTVVLTTAGPAFDLRKQLEKHRPASAVGPLVFLPQVLGLRQWLNQTPGLGQQGYAKNFLGRLLEVHRILLRHPHLQHLLAGQSDAASWGLAKGIIEACDLLSDAVLEDVKGTPEELDACLYEALGKVYWGASKGVIDLEAEVVLHFWKNLTSLQDPIVRSRYAMNVRGSSVQDAPLVFVRFAEGTRAHETALDLMLAGYANNQVVHDVVIDHGDMALWPEVGAGDDSVLLANRALLLSAHQERHIYRAQSFEDAAWVGAMAIQDFLKAGHIHIGLIAQDRLLARRIRALLARSNGLSIHDETGWKLSTTRAATALMSWLEIVRSGKRGPGAVLLMDFLKTPLIDWSVWGVDAAQAPAFLENLEKIFINESAKEGWHSLERALKQGQLASSSLLDRELGLLERLKILSQSWLNQQNSCANWRNLLIQTLSELGMYERLAADEAGAQLLAVFDEMELATVDALKVFEWISLATLLIEDAGYLEDSEKLGHRVTILPLSATRLRRFDAWVMVGCDDSQLPALAEMPLFISNDLRREMGMKAPEDEFISQARDLSQLMLAHSRWAMIWQEVGSAGEKRHPCGWLQRLYLNQPQRLKESYPLFEREVTPEDSGMPAPVVSKGYPKPSQISPSSYRLLRECPYRFFVRKILHLSEEAVLDEDIDSRVLGQLLHQILKNFSHGLKTMPISIGSVDARRQEMIARLLNISESVFEEVIDLNASLLGAYTEWLELVPQWIDWQLSREAAGWEFLDAERYVKKRLDTSFGGIDLVGQIDRVDVLGSEAAVIDYKYAKPEQFSQRLRWIDDDPQLLLYGFLLEGVEWLGSHRRVAQALLVSLRDDVIDRGVDDVSQRAQQAVEQLRRDLESVWNEQPMPANGPDHVCQYCESRGLCRKGMWE